MVMAFSFYFLPSLDWAIMEKYKNIVEELNLEFWDREGLPLENFYSKGLPVYFNTTVSNANRKLV